MTVLTDDQWQKLIPKLRALPPPDRTGNALGIDRAGRLDREGDRCGSGAVQSHADDRAQLALECRAGAAPSA